MSNRQLEYAIIEWLGKYEPNPDDPTHPFVSTTESVSQLQPVVHVDCVYESRSRAEGIVAPKPVYRGAGFDAVDPCVGYDGNHVVSYHVRAAREVEGLSVHGDESHISFLSTSFCFSHLKYSILNPTIIFSFNKRAQLRMH